MARKQTHRGATLNVRVPVKTRFGAELLCQKYGVPLSTIVNRAVEMLMKQEGLTSRNEGELLSLLDRLWDESEYRRLRNIETHTPELLSALDREVLRQMDHDLLFETGVDTAILDSEVTRLRKVFSEL